MASYTATSTKSYMLAMMHMMSSIERLSPPEIEKNYVIDKDHQKINNVDRLISNFDDVSVDRVKSIIEGNSSANDTVKEEIKMRCNKIDSAIQEPEGRIYSKVRDLVSTSGGDEELQSGLFDMLGFEQFELISKIVQNKGAIGESEESNIKEKRFLTAEEQADKINERRSRLKDEVLDTKVSLKKYPHVFKKQDVGDLMLIANSGVALPSGATRTNYGLYEEVLIPAPEKKTNQWITDDKLVRIKDLDFICRNTFKNYRTLNQMQSLVFSVAYNTNENMLICAPTGAGKTDVALLTILHTIDQFVVETLSDDQSGTIGIDCDEFKIVYVAPLKALAAEIVEKFSDKLKWLGINVRELTGDMQLTKQEIINTQVIVTTPEKWDVVTRKLNGDTELVSKVRLLIIDEVHLLHEERGSVIETLVARTLRQVESSQLMIRVVGLSATLPNYVDVADFLGVNRSVGMFYFDQAFRPCPLEQQLIGVRGKPGSKVAKDNENRACYDKLAENISNGHQVMVFVNSRRDTARVARTFISLAQGNQELGIFDASNECPLYDRFKREVGNKNRDKDLKDLFPYGFGIHHAGMLRTDRKLTENMFLEGAIKVLCCTATLAWGVNLPAAVVIIKGTQLYDAKQGGFVDLGISDVLQIFGRAGRPQFESFGTGILCTSSDKLDRYISLLTHQHPIESKLSAKLLDILNAEISLGSVTNVDEGVQWLGYTYMFVRMRQNPFSYGIDSQTLRDDPLLIMRRRDMIIDSARKLQKLQMIMFDEVSGTLAPKNLGRVASDFYLLNGTVEIFNNLLNPLATEADILSTISLSGEFDSIKYREEESNELKDLAEKNAHCQLGSEIESPQGKTNILLQAYLSQANIKNSTLISDVNYISQNAARICRAMFLICIDRRWSTLSKMVLTLCISVDKRIWSFDHPLAQFDLPLHILRQLRTKNTPMEMLKDMDSMELGDLVHNNKMGKILHHLVAKFPLVHIDSEAFPITKNVMRIRLNLEPDFQWDERYHGNIQFFWLFVEESNKSDLLHVEKFLLHKRLMKGLHEIEFMIPLTDPLPPQIIVRCISDTFLGSESTHAISFQHLIRPTNESIRTNLLRLQPLPITALHNSEVEAIYSKRFQYFNPMQTMVFHSLYHSNSNVFVGSPTGSGKTVVAELCIWQALNEMPDSKIVYIAPMKALVRERVDDWRSRICGSTKLKLVELTGDYLPHAREVKDANIIITTPEKFDGISRNWQTRKFVQKVSLVIMDEIHLLASDRGPILEMIVSRMNYISSQTSKAIRLLGMSTAVSNAFDMASWLGVRDGLFNFPQSVRPVPLQMYIDGFPDNLAFCPLMKTMNKPAFMAIKQHSPSKPVLIFVASRRQTRLTALDLIHLCGSESNPRRFLRMEDLELQSILKEVKDETLRLALQFGIGLHHAGLVESDRQISHKLFEGGKIQILVATSTLAWGVNLPAHLVIIKGTQFFDAKIEGYRDMDLTDVLQMMGRAGRPSFDTSGIAIVYTRESKKMFYKHFINLGFPVESSLHKVLDDHLGAEIAAGTISTKQEAMDFLTWTFLYRRVHNNPTYYGIEDVTTFGVSKYLTELIDSTLESLATSKCAIITGKDEIVATPFLHIASYYYLSHKTIRNMLAKMSKDMSFRECLAIVCEATEYDELATRHGEELINMELSQALRYPAEDLEKEFIWDPHVKAYLLIQAFMSRIELPIADYSQDTLSVLDQVLRIIQAYIDVASEQGYFDVVLSFISLMRCIKQRCWFDDNPVTTLPGMKLLSDDTSLKSLPSHLSSLTLSDLASTSTKKLEMIAYGFNVDNQNLGKDSLDQPSDDIALKEFLRIASRLPNCDVEIVQELTSALEISLKYKNFSLGSDFVTYCPHFPKLQRESWFIILSDLSTAELFLLKRASPIMVKKRGLVKCLIDIPEELSGKSVIILCLHDAYVISYTERYLLK